MPAEALPLRAIFFDARDTLGSVDRPGHLVAFRPTTEALLEYVKSMGVKIGVITNLPDNVSSEQGRLMVTSAILSEDPATGKIRTIGDYISTTSRHRTSSPITTSAWTNPTDPKRPLPANLKTGMGLFVYLINNFADQVQDAAKPDRFVPVIPNHFVSRNFNLKRFVRENAKGERVMIDDINGIEDKENDPGRRRSASRHCGPSITTKATATGPVSTVRWPAGPFSPASAINLTINSSHRINSHERRARSHGSRAGLRADAL